MKIFKLALIALLALNAHPGKATSPAEALANILSHAKKIESNVANNTRLYTAIIGIYAAGIAAYSYFKYLSIKRNFDLYNAIYDGNIIKINKLIKEGAN